MMDDLSKLRNIGIAAHIDAGKTTTTERVLYYSGTTHKMGDVDYGTTVTDFDVEEQERGITIYSAAVTLHWKDFTLNLIDTPGHVDFTAEVERSLRVLDGAVIVFDAKEGVEAQSETVWRQADKYDVPRICFINKMDKVGADFLHAFATIRVRLASNPIAVQIPIGQENSFRGMIDLIAMKALIYSGEGEKTEFKVAEIPDELRDSAVKYRHLLEERAAEFDDALMHKYVESQPIDNEEIVAALRKGTIAGQCQPVLCGSSLRYIGVQPMLDAVCAYLPSPLDRPAVKGHDPQKPDRIIRRKCDPDEPLAALVFKVVADAHSDLHFIRIYSGTLKAGSRVINVGRNLKENVPKLFRMFAKRRDAIKQASAGDIAVAIGLKHTLTGDTLCDKRGPLLLETIEFPEQVISVAIEPAVTSDRDKLDNALAMLARSDPTFSYRTVAETGQMLISGMGELHLEVICHRLERDMNVKVRVGKPRVAYREAITKTAEAEGRCIRQAGGKGQYAVVKLRVENFKPAKDQDHFEFESELSAGAIRDEFIPAIEAGARGAVASGPRGGYPLINVKVTLIDAQEHAEDSSEIAFESAAAMAFHQAVENAGPVLLEPVMKVEIVTPEEYFGPINSDLAMRRAAITATTIRAKAHVIDANIPLSTMFGYATLLRSLSQGRAAFSMEPHKYAAMPSDLADKVLGGL